MDNSAERPERINKYNLPIVISVCVSLLTLVSIFYLGAKILQIIYIFSQIAGLLWVILLFAVLIFQNLKKYIVVQSITSAYIIFGGVLLVSLSRFKDEIAKAPIDLNVVGLGVALIAFGFQIADQQRQMASKKEKQVESSNVSQNMNANTQDNSVVAQKLPSIDIVLEEARRTLDFQFEQLDGLDTKSGIVIGISGVILTLLITALIGKPDVFSSISAKGLTIFGIVVLFTSLFLSYKNLHIRKWNKPPDPLTLRKEYIIDEAKKTKLKIIDTMLKAIGENEAVLKKRFFMYKLSYIVLLVGLGLIAIGAILILYYKF